MEKQQSPYGSWHSPISADLVSRSAHTLSQVKVDQAIVYWLEQFPDQQGRCAILCCDQQGEVHELTPRNDSVRTRVHEYGGGDYIVHQGVIYFVNDHDQRLYRQALHQIPQPITPESPTPMMWRYAEMTVTPDGKHVICVRETHHDAQHVVNEIVSVATDASFAINLLASGNDFYASPQINAAADGLLFLCWDHPQMPWDGTQLCYAKIDKQLNLYDLKVIAGSAEEAIYQPRFSPEQDIYFVSDKSGWWNIYKYKEGRTARVVKAQAELGYPMWILGTNMYEFIGPEKLACIINEKGHYSIGIVHRGKIKKISTEQTDFQPYLAQDNQALYCIGASAGAAYAVLKIKLTSHHVQVLHSSLGLIMDAAYFSLPEMIEFPTDNHQTAYANFYRPNNPHYVAPATELPPLVMICHGGPTAAASLSLNLKIQYWTSRGFAVLDVNYGGSTGFGREYRERLKGWWGVVDVADCVNAVKFLVKKGWVDGKRLAIKGSSAGGYTVLCALIFHDLFAAGVSYYGVADLEALAQETHKFEKYYLEQLIGPYPKAQLLYQQRSPVNHAAKLSCPVIFFQGLEDRVVPPSQVLAMLQVLDRNGLPYAYVTFAHEQHGFRDAKSITQALESELAFYSQRFKFVPHDKVPAVKLHHFDETS